MLPAAAGVCRGRGASRPARRQAARAGRCRSAGAHPKGRGGAGRCETPGASSRPVAITTNGRRFLSRCQVKYDSSNIELWIYMED